MHGLYELKEKLMDELEEYGSKDEMTAGTLEVVDKLAHTVKNLCKIIEDMEYSEESAYDGGSYARGGNRGGSSRAMNSMRGGSYARGGGRGGNARRDSMGRYSSDSSLAQELRELMQDAPDERTRMEMQKLVSKLERM